VMAESQLVYDVKHIEKIVDQVFPLVAQAEFIKSVHDRDEMKLKAWRVNRRGNKGECFSEAVAFMRQVMLLKSRYYSECATKLKRNLETVGFDNEWNISLHPPDEPKEQPKQRVDDVWLEFEMDDPFPSLTDQEYAQYLHAGWALLNPDEDYVGDGNLDAPENNNAHMFVKLMEPMGYEIHMSDGSDSEMDDSMDIGYAQNLSSSSSSSISLAHSSISVNSGFQNDHLGFEMDCDQDGMPLDFLE
ncbi:hypothetical protein PFISCL1PPCAC_28223, partial [Pristionchus fissidentatus]